MKCPKCHFENPDDTLYCGKCATSLRPAHELAQSPTLTLRTPLSILPKGTLVAGKYKILGEIGRGGIGVVYKAEDTRLKRPVALKFLTQELTNAAEARERFIQEAQTASSLDHPNICNIHEIEETESGEMFIAMACYEGESLREKTKQGPLKQEEALDIAIQTATGLAKAHENNIVHRDIKPANIFITRDGLAKILDFGIAKLTGEVRLTRTGETIGTVAYMSPEQAQGKAVDHRTDIWSLGVMLYEMLTGQLPFGGEHEGTILYSIVHKSPEPIRKTAPKVSPELERVVKKALEKKPADRYQTMGELLEDFKALAEGMSPMRARPRFFKGRVLGIKRIPFFAVLIVLGALIGFGLFKIIPSHGEALDSIAILPLVNDSGDPSQDYFANSLTDRLIAEFYKVSALRVVSRQAVMAYAKTTKSPQQIAQELNVKAIVEASVLKSGNRIRLIARLIDPKRNQQIWSDTLEREYSDILFLQSDLAQAIVKGIAVSVQPEERELLTSARKVNPEAYDLFLQAIEWRTDISWEEQLSRAIDTLERAIAIDPESALAHAWLGYEYWMQGFNFVRNEKEVYPRAKVALSKALELDPNLGIAHAHMGWIKCTVDWDFAGADESWKRAIELLPGDPDIKFNYSVYLGQIVGRFKEGIAILERLKDEPKYQRIWAYKLAMYLLDAKRYDEAFETAKNAAARDETNLINLVMLAEAYASKEMHAEALSVEKKLMESSAAKNEPAFIIESARIQALAGQQEEALRSLEKLKDSLSKKNIDESFSLAIFYTALGDKEQAFKHLTDAYNEHSGQMIYIKYSWWFPSLHDDPRFQDLVKKVGFPEVHTPSQKR